MKAYLCILLSFLIACVVTPASAQLDSGLLLYYPFDVDEGATVTDQSSGGNDGTVVGATWTEYGAVGGCYSFDGGGYIDCGDLANVEGQRQLSFGAWVRPTNQALHGIVGKTASLDECFHLVADNRPGCWNVYEARVFMAEPNYSHGCWITNHFIMDTWQHVMATYADGYLKMYYNGELMSSSVLGPTGTVRANSRNASVGDDAVGRHWRFKGKIDEVRVYGRALSAEEVRELYRQDSLVLHYTFDTDEGGAVTDQSSWGNDGTVVGATFDPNGMCGGAMAFDGSNDYIVAAESPSLTVPGDMTLAAWFRPDSYGTHQKSLVEWRYVDVPGVHMCAGGAGGAQWGGNGTGVNFVDPTGDNNTHVIGVPSVDLGVWHHMAVTYNQVSGMARLYLDGFLEKEQNIGVFTPETRRDFYVGTKIKSNGTTAYDFEGLLDDLRVYNRALSPAEIYGLYEACAPGAGPGGGPFIAAIGFSDAPDGDQDVTEFLAGETLHIYVKDVDVDPADPGCSVLVTVFQKKKWSDAKKSRKARFYLDPQKDGSFTGAVPLDEFGIGMVEVQILSKKKGTKAKLQRTGYIFINPAP